jgi:hypothetical protein
MGAWLWVWQILYYLFIYLFIHLLVGLGFEIRTFALTKQVLYHLSHSAGPFL